MLLTEVKFAAMAMRRKLRDTHTVHMSNAYYKRINQKFTKGDNRTMLKAGVMIALSKPYGQKEQHLMRIPQGLEGYIVHITQQIPGGRTLNIIGVYSPNDDKTRKRKMVEYVEREYNRIQETEWEEMICGGDFN